MSLATHGLILLEPIHYDDLWIAALAAGRGRRSVMFRHGPTCLSGPVTRARPWWGDSKTRRNAKGRDAVMDKPATECSREDRPIRADLVERVRREIAEGTYDTPEKWEKALDRLVERLEEDD